MVQAIKLVFSDMRFALMAVVIFTSMTMGLLILSEYVFLEPYVVGHIPPGTEAGLALILAVSAVSALVIPMNLFRIAVLNRSKRKIGGGVFGSVIGVSAGACSCGPVGIAVISTFGSLGATATTLLTDYEIPIRAAALAILIAMYFTTARSLKSECGIGK